MIVASSSFMASLRRHLRISPASRPLVPLLLFAMPVALAQEPTGRTSAPTLRDTLSWLKEKLPLATDHYVMDLTNTVASDMGKTKEVTLTTTPIAFESCTVIFEAKEVDMWDKFPGAHSGETTRYTVPLAEVSKVEVLKIEVPLVLSKELTVSKKAIEWAVFVNTASNEVLEETHTYPPEKTKSQARKYAAISFNDESLANRVAVAFRHAAHLCHGSEPF